MPRFFSPPPERLQTPPFQGGRPSGPVLFTGACLAAALAAGDAAAVAPYAWLRDESTAVLVVEPAPLPGVRRWTIESPRHRGRIAAASFSPDGKRIATGGIDGVIRIWEVETGRLERALTGFRWNVQELAWSPDGRKLAANSPTEALIRVWDPAAGRLLTELERSVQRLICWAPDSRRLAACGGASGAVFVSDNLGPFQEITAVGQPITAFAWSAGDRFVVADDTNPIAIHDGKTGRHSVSLADSGGLRATAVAWSPDGSRLATLSSGKVTVWDGASGEPIHVSPLSGLHVDWSPNGRTLVVQGGSGLSFRAADTGDESARCVVPPGTWMRWQPSHDQVVTLREGRLQFWKPGEPAAVRSLEVGAAEPPLFRPGGPIVTGLGGDRLRLWDATTFTATHELAGSGKPLVAARLSSGGGEVAACDDAGGVRVWDTASGASWGDNLPTAGPFRCLEWSADGTRLALGDRDKIIRIVTHDDPAGTPLEGHAAHVRAIAWAPTGRQLVSAATDKSLVVWDAESGKQAVTTSLDMEASALAWGVIRGTPALACGFTNTGLRVLNPATGQPLATVEKGTSVPGYPITTVAWLPAARPLMLAGQTYHLVELFDTAAAKPLSRQLAPGGAVETLAMNKGSLVATRSLDRTLRFWDPATGRLKASLLDEGGVPVLIAANGELRHPAAVEPELIALVETADGQKTIPLAEFSRKYQRTPGGKKLALPRSE